jgi:hypothetical protein
MEQTPAQLGALLRDAAIARVDDAADEDWKAAAIAAIRKIAAHRAELTTDHVWEALGELRVFTHEHRAMGAVMRAAHSAGLIVKTDRVVPTRRPGAHRRPIAVWRSLCIH